jgi:hypothetical protein
MQEEYEGYEPNDFNYRDVAFSDPKQRFEENFELFAYD